MATQTLHYHLTKPASADRVAVGDINDNSDTIDGYLYQANERADQLADDYNTSSTYNTGDYVRRDNYIYKCNTDNTTGTWDATKWDRVKVMDEITQGGGGGGSSTLAGLSDVSVSGVANKDIIRYNSTTRKYEKSSDLTDLELSVSQLSSSVLSIAGDVNTLELTVSQMSASTLPYDANTSTKQKIDNVESSIPTSASDLPYSSTQSTKDAIDEAMYYKAGDTYEIPTGYQQFPARLGWSRARVIVTFSLPKVVKGNLTASNIILPPTITIYAKDEGRTCTITNIGVNSICENIISLMINITPSTAWSTSGDSIAIVETPTQTGEKIKFTFS